MNAQWRLFVAALRNVISGPGADSRYLEPPEASRFLSLAGMCVGLLGAFVYWLAAQVWPASVALMLSLFATALATGDVQQRGTAWVFALFIKYNALMALSSANVPIPLPDNVALGLIMVAGRAASHALGVSVVGGRPRVAAMDLSIALCVGFVPAAFLGIPGLVGLAVAIAIRLLLTTLVFPRFPVDPHARLAVTLQFAEIGLYLGALAAWHYI